MFEDAKPFIDILAVSDCNFLLQQMTTILSAESHLVPIYTISMGMGCPGVPGQGGEDVPADRPSAE